MPSDVPKARDIVLSVLEGERPLSDLAEALTMMTRDKYLRHAGVECNKVNKEIRDAVKRDLVDPRYAGLSRAKMGRRHNIGSGRVTEIDQGRYDNL